MKRLFDEISCQTAVQVTKKYSTSFSMGIRLLHPSIRQDVYNVYGFVRIADEIVDSFLAYPQEELLDSFEEDLWAALDKGISTNPIIHAFQLTVRKNHIPHSLIQAFLNSMRMDLTKRVYTDAQQIEEYIHGSADVVGLMCLKIFVKGDDAEYERLKDSAVRLGSAFQKVNFLRDLKEDFEELDRIYFPSMAGKGFNDLVKNEIITEIKKDFKSAMRGIRELPIEARFGVYLASQYYMRLLYKLVLTPADVIRTRRVRVSGPGKLMVLVRSFFSFKLDLI